MDVPRDRRQPTNAVAEWFGHRVYPTVSATAEALSDQQSHRCPFLSTAIAETRQCIKLPRSLGVCTISSTSNGTRQDWLVCPYRALDRGLVDDAARRLFGVASGRAVVVRAANTLDRAEVRKEVLADLSRGDAVFVYMQDKLGGEVSLIPQRDPEISGAVL